MKVLKKEILQEIKKSNKLRGLIMIELDKADKTIIGYVDDKDPILTIPSVLKIISTETNCKVSELLEEVEA